ncbi:MAG: type III-B CRISPR module RAMP protein Cmr6 [Acidobacteriota bacterium]
MTRYTWIDDELPQGIPSPTLLLHKRHGYDRFHQEHDQHGRPLKAFDHKEARGHELKAICHSVSEVMRDHYAAWHDAYVVSLADLGVDIQNALGVRTAWRLAIGWGTNPALETGITLHQLLGFPFIPGSAVKGLLHHVAEMDLMEEPDPIPDAPPQVGTGAPPPGLLAAIARAKLVRALFGSLFIERHVDKSKNEYGPMTPCSRLRQWKARIIEANEHQPGSPWHQVFGDISVLTGTTATGGMVTCYDAVPAPDTKAMQNEVLQVDILNPHYPDYYKDPSTQPTDKQNPTPVYFLTVRPATSFEFYFQLDCMPREPARDDAEKERSDALCLWSEDDVRHMLKRWLQQGLQLWGIGGKTAAGYGHFAFRADDLHAPGSDEGGAQAAERQGVSQPADKSLPGPDERARQLLPLNLIPGELESHVLAALREPCDVQAEVARLLRQHYSDRVKKWRKKSATSETVRKRIDWLDSFPD